MNRYGITLPKPNEFIDQIQSDLMIKPKVHPDYDTNIPKYPIYTETETSITIPRYYAKNYLHYPLPPTFPPYEEYNFQFLGNLRDKQPEIAEICLNYLRTHGGGILSLHCGAGKTVLALYILAILGVKTLIVVHKTFLLNQWIERIEQYLGIDKSNIGIIRQKIIRPKPITVAMLQSVAMIDYNMDIFDSFGLVIYDEAHHCASRVFCKALAKLNTKYTLGLSATPFRQDGLTKVLYWYLGPIIYRLVRKGENRVHVKNIMYHSTHKLFCDKTQRLKGKVKPAHQRMITNLHKINERNEFIVDIIEHLTITLKEGRKTLILSGRLEHLKILKKLIDTRIKSLPDLDNNEYTTSYYIGGMKDWALDVAAEADIIFATYSMAEEGLDINGLNTLILATPKKNIEQAAGRILRKSVEDGDTPPLIIDIADQLDAFKGWEEARTKFFTSQNYTVRGAIVYDRDFVSLFDYLGRKGIVAEDLVKAREMYIKDMYNEFYYEMCVENDFEGEELEKYDFKTNIEEVCRTINERIDKEVGEYDDDDPNNAKTIFDD